MQHVRMQLVAVAVMTFLLSSCGGREPSSEALGAGSQAPIQLVVIGDSLANPGGVCAGCTGFVEQYAEMMTELLGRPTESKVVPAGGVPDAEQAVFGDPAAQGMIAAADVVVVQVGYNNALPDPETGIGCGGSLSLGFVPWMRSTKPACLEQGVATYGSLYDRIFSRIKELRDGNPSVFVLTNTIDGNIDPTTPGLVGEIAKGDRRYARQWAVAAYDRWNTMLRERAEAAGFAYVDLYHAVNGPDGTETFGELSSDGAHPSQLGNDLIAAKLAEVDLSALMSR